MSGPKAPAGKVILSYGTHSGTLTSRDSGDPIEYDSEATLRREFPELKASYEGLGCMIWFAFMYDDQGRQTVIDPGHPYI